VKPDMPLSEAIEIVTNGKLGVGIVLENEALVGIITDGDIRRAMMRLGQEFFATPVADIMSKNPKTISRTAKIVEAGEKMNHHSIHTLVVMSDQASAVSGQPYVVGVIDSFSCLPGTRFYH
jgi:arabinose-5-phosphate isomerase